MQSSAPREYVPRRGVYCLVSFVIACAAPANHDVQGQSPYSVEEPPPAESNTPEPTVPRRAQVPRRSAELRAAIAALPVVARLDDLAPTPFVLRGYLDDERAAAMERMARHVVADVARRFVNVRAAHGTELVPVDVCLFEDDDTYRVFAEVAGDGDNMMGFYLPRERLIVANLGRSVGNLRHELVHPLVGDDFRSRDRTLPAWFNEGLGSLYGTSRVRRARVTFLVNYRLRHVRKALRAGRLPTLEDIARSSRGEIYGPRSMTYYGTARYVLLYLDAQGTLSDFYAALIALDATFERQLELLDKYVDYDRFVRWTRRLKKGRQAPRPR